MATIFTRIAQGEIPSYKVAENEDYYAFLDISPLAQGHTLVIPKKVEDDYIFHLDEPVYAGLWDQITWNTSSTPSPVTAHMGTTFTPGNVSFTHSMIEFSFSSETRSFLFTAIMSDPDSCLM